MKISIIIPTRNNLKFLKKCYESICNEVENHKIEICIADDASTDGTVEWLKEMGRNADDFKYILNETGTRLGLVILYDKLIKEIASYDICLLFHADMILLPNALDAIEKHIKPGTVVSLTRVEPDLHPPGPEKVSLQGGPLEPEEMTHDVIMNIIAHMKQFVGRNTEGVFAPWAIYKQDFLAVDGHDIRFAPQSKEDSDIFNRLQLNGIKFIQTWDGYVYHFTSRGSRFNEYAGGSAGKDSPEWKYTTHKNMREFIRKWGTMVMHDEMMKPIIYPKFFRGARIKNCSYSLLEHLEPWFDFLYIDNSDTLKSTYVSAEASNTTVNLNSKIGPYGLPIITDILVDFDADSFTGMSFQVITQLNDLIKDCVPGTYEIDIFRITISHLNDSNIKYKTV